MNNGRIWCVVNPSVGLPLFLGSVALMAFTVHFAVLHNTTWFSNYWNGGAKAKVGMGDSTAPAVAQLGSGESSFVINTAPASGDTGASFVITVKPAPTGAMRTAAAIEDGSGGGAKGTR